MDYLSHTRITNIIFILFISLFFSSCEEETIEYFNNELIFSDAHEIVIPSYNYQSITGDIIVHGDEGFDNNSVDTITSTPPIRWDSVDSKLIVSAIFINPIQVADGKIQNTNDIVWIWHSGLANVNNGRVTFEEGRSLSGNAIEDTDQPIPLPAFHQYYWGVWGWNESGIKVQYSSRQMTFYVK